MKNILVLLSLIVVFVGCSKSFSDEEFLVPDPKPEPAYDGITVTVNRSSKYMVSDFQIGNSIVTQVLRPYGGNPIALNRMWEYMQAGNMNFQNFHIMGWGLATLGQIKTSQSILVIWNTILTQPDLD